jgi:hypothetical protein
MKPSSIWNRIAQVSTDRPAWMAELLRMFIEIGLVGLVETKKMRIS